MMENWLKVYRVKPNICSYHCLTIFISKVTQYYFLQTAILVCMLQSDNSRVQYAIIANKYVIN